uniref:Transposase n=1 Tax=Heligmosomoides polygyrus TaxID=6339 RepID=A0A183FCA3_HELPZ
LAEVQKKNETLRAQIADMETKLLQRRVAALDLASEKLKEKPVPAVRKKAPSSAGF